MSEFNPKTHWLTPEEARQRRTEWMEGPFRAMVADRFRKFPEAQSLTLAVAQYWNDEADDAVHCQLLLSSERDPDFAELSASYDNWNYGRSRDYGSLLGLDVSWYSEWGFRHYLTEGGWENNSEAITLFAAFCKEGSTQEDTLEEAYLPIARAYRPQQEEFADEDVTINFFGEMVRPESDGIWPEWAQEDDGQKMRCKAHGGGMTKAIEQWKRASKVHPFSTYFEGGYRGPRTHPVKDEEGQYRKNEIFRFTGHQSGVVYAGAELTVREDFLPKLLKDPKLLQLLQDELFRRKNAATGIFHFMWENYNDWIKN